MEIIVVDGQALNVVEQGNPDGPALVFANSLGTDHRVWDRVVPAFTADFRVIRYDKRGHGLSDAPTGDYTIAEHTADLIGILDAKGISKAAVAGVSVGGLIAQSLALTATERVSALILSNTAAKIGTAESWAERIAALESGGIASIADAILDRWFSPDFFAHRADELRGWRNMLLRTPLAGYRGTCAAIRDADFRDRVGTVAVPTLCIGGRHDGSTPPEAVQALADAIPGARFVLIEEAGHLPCVEAPAAVIAAMRSMFVGNG